MASGTASNNPHAGHVIKWPVILNGYLEPSRGKTDQYEFHCHNKHNRHTIDSKLPLIPGDPYKVTVSPTEDQRNKGIGVTCKFNKQTVKGQFHRFSPSTKNKSIWIGSNYRNGGRSATAQWHKFVSYFGITVGVHHTQIPVYLEFHPTLEIVIRLRNES